MITLDEAGRGTPSASVRQPRPELQRFVELSWIQRVTEEQRASARDWRIVPDPSAHLIFQARRSVVDGRETDGATSHRLALVGPRSVYTDIDRSSRTFSVGVRFRPGAVHSLFGIAPREILDRGVRVRDVVARWGREVSERMAECAEDPDSALRVLEDSLVSRIGRWGGIDSRVAAAATLIERRGGRMTVDDLCRELGVAPRTLRKTMREHVGLAPKRIMRIRRLYRAIRLLHRRSRVDGSSVAHAAGYFDQPHMIRDFNALLGETPERFASRGRRRRAPH